MADKKRIGAGTILEISDMAGTPVWQAVPEVRRIDPITQTKPFVDATALSSTGREFVSGIAEGDEFNVESYLIMDNAVQATIRGLFASGNNNDFRITPAGQSKRIAFNGIITQLVEGPFELETTMPFTFRIKVSGGVTNPTVP